jgi:hypothetical protein
MANFQKHELPERSSSATILSLRVSQIVALTLIPLSCEINTFGVRHGGSFYGLKTDGDRNHTGSEESNDITFMQFATALEAQRFNILTGSKSVAEGNGVNTDIEVNSGEFIGLFRVEPGHLPKFNQAGVTSTSSVSQARH